MTVVQTSSEPKLFLLASLDQMSFELTSFEQSYSKQMLLEQRMSLPMTKWQFETNVIRTKNSIEQIYFEQTNAFRRKSRFNEEVARRARKPPSHRHTHIATGATPTHMVLKKKKEKKEKKKKRKNKSKKKRNTGKEEIQLMISRNEITKNCC